MRILIENSGYALLNIGDLAMLQVGVARIRERWPGARIEVLTSDELRLEEFVPGTIALNTELAGRSQLLQRGFVIGGWHRFFPGRTKRLPLQLESALRTYFPNFATKFASLRFRLQPVDFAPMWSYFDAVRNADAVVSTGGGFFTDEFPDQALGVAFTLRLAQQTGKPTALLGQGLGPLKAFRVQRELRRVSSQAKVVALREGREGPKLLERLGVPTNHVVVTGDDAVEMAYAQRRPELGAHIGLNVRKSYYSGLDINHISCLRSVMAEFISEFETTVVPVPISWYEEESEIDNIKSIAEGLPSALWDTPGLHTPEGVIRQVGTCRLVVTGSYHAGVFALSQGIPVVGLAKSAYYQDKFLGLAAQFGEGCWVVSLDSPDLASTLREAIRAAWVGAEALRPRLLKAAEDQIARGRAAYEEFFDIVDQQCGNLKEKR